MSTLLKDIYSKEFYARFSETLSAVVPNFDEKKFVKQIFDETWHAKELKARMKHTSAVLNTLLPQDFSKAATMIEEIIKTLRQNNVKESSLEYMFLPDYIETYGINDYESSVKTMVLVTQFTSCEFAVRPFIVKYKGKMLERMHQWSLHESHHVRRLASEGSRPRLPWAIALPELKNNPAPILPILENLKNDPSEYVRRSVANSLNDISKDNPDVVISVAKKWKGQSKETDAILKHASRTLLKQGNPVILSHFGVADNAHLVASAFEIITPKIKIGESLEFSFCIQNTGATPLNVRLEYAIHYLRNNGQHSKKVFKISERQLNPTEKLNITRKQSFKIITTRKYYAGPQKLSLIINGSEKSTGGFELQLA